MINNKELHTSLESLTKKVIPIYGRKAASLEGPQKYSTYIAIVLMKLDESIKELDEFKKCLSVFQKVSKLMSLKGKLVGTQSSMSSIPDESDCILSFLMSVYLKSEAFDEAFINFENLFYSDTIQIEESTRLYNFAFSGTEIDFGEGLEIVLSVENTLDDTLSLESRLEIDRKNKWYSSEFIIKAIINAPKLIKSSTDIDGEIKNSQSQKAIKEFKIIDAESIFDDVITTLRIFKKSAVYRDHKIKSKRITFHPRGAREIRSPMLENTVVGKKCEIENKEITEIKNIFSFIRTETESRFIVARNRLADGLTRKAREDRVIDFMIGLEALYLPDGNYELTFRLSLRVAFLLSSTKEDRKELFNFVKKMYGTRSSIVHGSKYKLDDVDINHLEDLLRKSLKLWIDDKQNFSVNKFTNSGNLKTEGKLDNIFFE